MIRVGMNVASTTATSTALQGVSNGGEKRMALQMAILKKALDAQQDQAAQIFRQLEGKGQVVDLRV